MRVTEEAIERFLAAWHENSLLAKQRGYGLWYGKPKVAHWRRKYVSCDCGSEGVFMVEREGVSPRVFTIRGYARADRLIGPLQDLTRHFHLATQLGRVIQITTSAATVRSFHDEIQRQWEEVRELLPEG